MLIRFIYLLALPSFNAEDSQACSVDKINMDIAEGNLLDLNILGSNKYKMALLNCKESFAPNPRVVFYEISTCITFPNVLECIESVPHTGCSNDYGIKKIPYLLTEGQKTLYLCDGEDPNSLKVGICSERNGSYHIFTEDQSEKICQKNLPLQCVKSQSGFPFLCKECDPNYYLDEFVCKKCSAGNNLAKTLSAGIFAFLLYLSIGTIIQVFPDVTWIMIVTVVLISQTLNFLHIVLTRNGGSSITMYFSVFNFQIDFLKPNCDFKVDFIWTFYMQIIFLIFGFITFMIPAFVKCAMAKGESLSIRMRPATKSAVFFNVWAHLSIGILAVSHLLLFKDKDDNVTVFAYQSVKEIGISVIVLSTLILLSHTIGFPAILLFVYIFYNKWPKNRFSSQTKEKIEKQHRQTFGITKDGLNEVCPAFLGIFLMNSFFILRPYMFGSIGIYANLSIFMSIVGRFVAIHFYPLVNSYANETISGLLFGQIFTMIVASLVRYKEFYFWKESIVTTLTMLIINLLLLVVAIGLVILLHYKPDFLLRDVKLKPKPA